MRIISEVKDYYDFLSDSSDKQHIWKRNNKLTYISKDDVNFKNFNNYYKNNNPYSHSVIGARSWSKSTKEFNRNVIEFKTSLLMVCGNPYIIMTVSENPNKCFYFDQDDFEQIIKDYSIKESRSYFWIKGNITAYEHIMQGNMPDYIKNINLNYKCPIIHIKHIEYYDDLSTTFNFELELNPSLKNIQFEKYHDPYTVFQNVERYIWNDMITTSDFEDNISNQDKIESHGFNEWSFRKPSTKSK